MKKHVYSFLFFASSRPRIQAEFLNSKCLKTLRKKPINLELLTYNLKTDINNAKR